MPFITIDVSDFALEHLSSEQISRLTESEALRLWHIARSVPKQAPKPKSPVGVRLLAMFAKRKAALGLTARQEAAVAKVQNAIDLGDSESLAQMWRDQIWLNK